MARCALASTLLAIGVIALACGGGSSGSVTYAPTVVPIKHIDFARVDLTLTDISNTPSELADRYPAVVATVNGQPVAGASLAHAEIGIEWNRRQVEDQDVFDLITPSALDEPDALAMAIDAELRHQAVIRLNLLSSYDEAAQLAKEQEDIVLHGTATPDPEVLESYRLKGFPESDWASDPKVVEIYRYVMGDNQLSAEICKQVHTPIIQTPGQFRSSSTCDEFLAKERRNAKIVYYVRWAD